jgi:hypothetical protein
MMTVDSHAQVSSDPMATRRLTSPQAADRQTVAKMKARQSAKIRDIANALIAAGFCTLSAQAQILGMGRSTVWTILRSNHKGSGLSAKVVNRILSRRSMPPLVRKTVLEYVEEKASGHYGHSAKVRRKFITALSAMRIEAAEKVRTKALTTRAARDNLKMTSVYDHASAERSSEPVRVAKRTPRSRRMG